MAEAARATLGSGRRAPAKAQRDTGTATRPEGITRRLEVQVLPPQPRKLKPGPSDQVFSFHDYRMEEGGLEPEKARPSRDSPVDCRAGSGSRGLNEAPQTGGCRSAADAQVLPPQLLEILIWE